MTLSVIAQYWAVRSPRGPVGPLLLASYGATFVLTIWALLDAVRFPSDTWTLAGHRRALWMPLFVAAFFLGTFGLPITVYYAGAVHAELTQVTNSDSRTPIVQR